MAKKQITITPKDFDDAYSHAAEFPFPHTSGGYPHYYCDFSITVDFSPHKWGLSLDTRTNIWDKYAFPHIRGGYPSIMSKGV